MMRRRSWSKIHRHAELMHRWKALCQGLGLSARLAHLQGQGLINSWDHLPRHYHDTTHLMACLGGLDQVKNQMQDPNAAELALWFHDAIYWPRRKDNEERSAQWAAQFMTTAGLPVTQRDQVVRLILETKHSARPSQGDARFVIDIDLGILGQNDAAYKAFERNVRKEYRWVPWIDYVKRRSAVLQSFLDRPRIYSTDWFRERLETQARSNLQRQIELLLPPLGITDTTRF